jgi:hypothetical protein
MKSKQQKNHSWRRHEPAMSEPFLPADTSLEAARVQHAVYRRMSPERRLHLAFQMTASARKLSAAGVRARHPEYTDRQVELAVIRMMLGEELFRRAYPDEDVVP